MASADKSSFDVYGMLTILSTLLLGGACYLLYDRLSSEWGFTMFGEKPKDQTWHLTELRPVNVNLPIVKLRKEDLEEWQAIRKGQTFPKKDFEWPKDYDPVQFPLKPSVNAWDMTKDPTEGEKWKTALEALIASRSKEETPPEPPKTPEAPKDDKKDDANKAPEAPKADANKAPDAK